MDNQISPLIAPDGLRHLFVSDMDGTLLDDCSRVSPDTARILSWLGERGVMFTVATARTPATVEPLLRNTYTRLPAIVMTGAALWSRQLQSYESLHIMDPATSEGVLNTCLSHGIHPFLYRLAGEDGPLLRVYHSRHCAQKEREFIDDRRHLPLKHFHLVDDSVRSEMPTDNVILYFAIGQRDAIYAAANLLRAQYDCSVSSYPDIFNPHTGIMEVFAPGVSKGRAVKDLATMVGADRVTVFGDNLNDIAMMEAADKAVAVANAQPKVIQIADETIGPNTTDSVARYILKFYTGLDSL